MIESGNVNKKLVSTNQSAKVVLSKSKSLLNMTNSLLNKKSNSLNFQFFLTSYTNLTRIQRKAIDSEQPISIYADDIFDAKMALICFIKRLQKLQDRSKKTLLIVESELLRLSVKEKLQNYDCIYSLEEIRKKVHTEIYDEILVYDKYDIETLLYLKESCLSLSFLVFDKEYLKYFPDNRVFIFEEIILPSYETFNFARQFIPKDSKFNDSMCLENLKKRNSGADKPFVYLENSLDGVYQSIKNIIDENPTDNIGIILPYGNDEKNYDLSIEKYYRLISKGYTCSKYYEGIKLKKLHNIFITTYDEAIFIDFDIIILLQFDKVKKIVDNETIFSICSAENKLHIFQETYDEYNGLVEIIDNRNTPF